MVPKFVIRLVSLKSVIYKPFFRLFLLILDGVSPIMLFLAEHDGLKP